LLFDVDLEYAVRRVHVNQRGVRLNGTNQLFANSDDVDILGGSVHNIYKNTDALNVVNKENGLEINYDKTKYMLCLEIRMLDEVKT